VLPRLALAIDAALLFDTSPAGTGQAYALFIAHDDSMLPICSEGDRVVFRLESAWAGDGLYLLQQTAASPLMLRTVARVGSSYTVTSTSGGTTGAYATGMFAADEAEALNGAPIIRGRPAGLIRRLPGAAN
jgi:hypothetical protein